MCTAASDCGSGSVAHTNLVRIGMRTLHMNGKQLSCNSKRRLFSWSPGRVHLSGSSRINTSTEKHASVHKTGPFPSGRLSGNNRQSLIENGVQSRSRNWQSRLWEVSGRFDCCSQPKEAASRLLIQLNPWLADTSRNGTPGSSRRFHSVGCFRVTVRVTLPSWLANALSLH